MSHLSRAVMKPALTFDNFSNAIFTDFMSLDWNDLNFSTQFNKFTKLPHLYDYFRRHFGRIVVLASHSCFFTLS